MELKINEQYTIINISDALACTSKRQWTITGEENGRLFGTMDKKKKTYYLPKITNETLVFKGHNIPLTTDSETGRFFSNACLNFVVDDPKTAQEYIKTNNINPDFTAWHEIMFTMRGANNDEEYYPLFPEKVPEGWDFL